MLAKLLDFFPQDLLDNVLDELSQDLENDRWTMFCFAESDGGAAATADSHLDRHLQSREAHGIEFAVEHHDRVQVGRERVQIDDQRGERG